MIIFIQLVVAFTESLHQHLLKYIYTIVIGNI